MSIERTFSKAKAVGNRITWTQREIVPVTFKLDGVPVDGHEFAILRVPGRDMYLNGFRIDFDVPAGDALVNCSAQVFTAAGIAIPETLLRLDGVVSGADKIVTPPLQMPTKSVWKTIIRISSPFEDTTYYPQGITITYQLSYAASPVRTDRFTMTNPQVGVGFDQVGLSNPIL